MVRGVFHPEAVGAPDGTLRRDEVRGSRVATRANERLKVTETLPEENERGSSDVG